MTTKIINDLCNALQEKELYINISNHSLVFLSNKEQYELMFDNGVPKSIKQLDKKAFVYEQVPMLVEKRFQNAMKRLTLSDFGMQTIQDLDRFVINLDKFGNRYSINSLFLEMLDDLTFEHVKHVIDRAFYNDTLSGFLFSETERYINAFFEYNKNMTLDKLLKLNNAQELCKLIYNDVFKSENGKGCDSLVCILDDWTGDLINRVENTFDSQDYLNQAQKAVRAFAL